MLLASYYVPAVISLKENDNYPFLSAMMRATKSILIDREDPNSRQQAKKDIHRRAHLAKSDSRWHPMLIFPEGTCTNGRSLVMFAVGAFAPGVPVQPVFLRYPFTYQSLAWTKESEGIVSRFTKMLLQFVNWVEIEFLPVYVPDEEEKADPIIYAENVRKYMSKACGVPCTQHTYDDVRLLFLAQKLHVDNTAVKDVVLGDIQKLYHLNYEDAKHLLTKFVDSDRSKTGTLNYLDFCLLFGIPSDSEEMQVLFNMFDTNGDGTVDFKELLIGISQVGTSSSSEQLIRRCFETFDRDGNGSIDFSEFTIIMKKLFPRMNATQIQSFFAEMEKDVDGKLSYGVFSLFLKRNPVYLKLASEGLFRQGGLDSSASDVVQLS
eukprot:TRINITY_DN14569_c0_g3_i5.p1 TRINITY_DN14569_c0_g3~~TRINITY_DN14569_c0_g3_i5.p1  ORF type:complete len:377 (-),score=81.55 TRINITY_DN14569_c0_g3_i5:127-1257(-)